MSNIVNIAASITEAGFTAEASAAKPTIKQNPVQTAFDKIIDRLNASIDMLDSNTFDAKRACYTTTANTACVGIKYGNAYITFDDGNKFIVVSNNTDAIKATLNALISAVKNGDFDAEIQAAVKKQQQLSKQRYAKRKPKKQQAKAAPLYNHRGAA